MRRMNMHRSMIGRLLAVAMFACASLAANCAPSPADGAARTPTDETLRFTIREGDILNAFYRQGPIAAHLLLSSGRQPRALVAFPAGNSGVGLWFEPTSAPVEWRLRGEPRGITRRDPQARPLRGIEAEVETDAPRLVPREAVLGSVRVLRDYQVLGTRPDTVATKPQMKSRSLHWARPRLDGAPGYALSVEILAGEIAHESGKPQNSSIAITAPRNRPLRLRITALTGETPLTPLSSAQLLTDTAANDTRSRDALAFLSYQEKFLAGSWRFDTYFGRDTLMSMRLLLPALAPEAAEAGLGSVLERLNAGGEVAHEEDIGEFAVLRHRQEGDAGDAPIYDYNMIDDDFMLAPVAASYLLDHPQGRTRAAAFLARKTGTGERFGDALARNFAWVTAAAAPFAREQKANHLIALKSGKNTGQWRDSQDGLAGGRYPYDVNAVLVPAALSSIARLRTAGLLKPYLTPQQDNALANADRSANLWLRAAPPLFVFEINAKRARRAVSDYAKAQGVDPASALASLPKGTLRFNAIALDAKARAIPVLHSDDGFDLLFLDPPAPVLERSVQALMRPFPAGLMTDIGLLVANPAYADAHIQSLLGRNAYHGTVVWAWQQAVLAAGLDRQLQRNDLPETTRARLTDARTRLWSAIEAAHDVRTSELWSWSYADGRYRVEPFGQRGGDQDESNAAQLWSTVFLALKPPAPR